MSILTRLIKGLSTGLVRQSQLEIKANVLPAQRLPLKLLRGRGFGIVGESFYTANFSRLSKARKENASAYESNCASLVIEPQNKYSKSGKAVLVTVGGLPVGHIPERIAPFFFDFLEPLGGSAECYCQIYFDYRDDGHARNSVELFVSVPLVLEKENTDSKVDSLARGDFKHLLGEFQPVDLQGSPISGLNTGESYFGILNLRFSTTGIFIESTEGKTLLMAESIASSFQELKAKSAVLYYLPLIVRKNREAHEVWTLSEAELKIKKIRTGNSVSPEGNTLSQTHSICALPELNSWVRFKLENASLFSSLGLDEVAEPRGWLYLWALIDRDGRIFSEYFGLVLGRAYSKERSMLLSEFKGVPIHALVRIGKLDGKAQIEVNIDRDSELAKFAVRPYVPQDNRRLASKSPIVESKKAKKPAKKETEIVPSFSNDFDLSLLTQGSITGSGFTHLEQTVWSVAVDLGWRHDSRVTKSRSSIFISGSLSKLDTFSARDAAKFNVPIIPIALFREKAANELRRSHVYRALERYEHWLLQMGGDAVASDSPIDALLTNKFDVLLVPGGTVDSRSPSRDLSFIGELTGASESKEYLKDLFQQLGGEQLDSLIIRGLATFSGSSPKLRLEFHNNNVFLGRTPANQYESLAESAQYYGLKESWIRVDWKSANKFASSFDFYSSL